MYNKEKDEKLTIIYLLHSLHDFDTKEKKSSLNKLAVIPSKEIISCSFYALT